MSTTPAAPAPAPAPEQPRVGVGVFVLGPMEQVPDTAKPSRMRRFLMGRRQGSHGAGTWALPGGRLEFGESLEQCAARETLEETGLHITDVRTLTATSNVFEEVGKHYVTVFMAAWVDVERHGVERPQPTTVEPDKCDGWEWKTLEQLWEAAEGEMEGSEKGLDVRPLFSPLTALVRDREDVMGDLEMLSYG